MSVEWQSGRRLPFATVASLLISLIVLKTSAQDHKNVDSTPKKVCNTPACSQVAGDIRSFLDESVDPCDDFYRFSCGRWLDRQEGDATPQTSGDKRNKALIGALRMNLTGTEPGYVRKLVLMFDSCMNDERNRTLLIELFKKDFESLGGWPVLKGEAWDGKDFDWIDILLHMRQLGYGRFGEILNGLMELKVLPENIFDSVNKITLKKSAQEIDRDHLKDGFNNPQTFEDMKKKVERSILFGADKETAKADMRDVIELEIMLYKIPNFKNDSQKKYSVKELQNLAPQVNWMKYFNGMLVDPIYENDTVVLMEPEFIFQLVDLLERTDKRVVANYLFLRAADHYKFMFFEPGETNFCELLVMMHLQVAFQSSIANWQKFPDFSGEIDQFREWTEIIRKELVNMFDDANWLDSNSKNRAKEEASSILPVFGFPKEFYNESFLTTMHKNLNIKKGNWRDNFMKASKFHTDWVYGALRKPYNRTEWIHYSLDLPYIAYYESTKAFVVNEYQLEDIIYKGAPKYMNFGTMGFVIGLFIGLAGNGNYGLGWDENAKEQYKEKAKCIMEQYSNYTTDHGFQLNGEKTNNGDVACNVGYKAAYSGYQSWVRDHGEEAPLPGLKYSPNQLFWISAAKVWCRKITAEKEKENIDNDSGQYGYSPPKFTVIGAFSNRPEFANDFKCSVNSKMNPQKKCKVW